MKYEEENEDDVEENSKKEKIDMKLQWIQKNKIDW